MSPSEPTASPAPVADRDVAAQILADYAVLEPSRRDSWNPVGSKFQLGYRLNLFYAMATALACVDHEREDLRVLDFGCGTGRSTRLYLELGLRPAQVSGLDLREGALSLARDLNPAIPWIQHDGSELPRGHNWISATTVFSSVAGSEMRQRVATQMARSLPSGGYLFYYDARKANDFAGADVIAPRRLFGDLRIVWAQRLGRFTCFPLRDRLRGLVRSGLLGDAGHTVSLREMIGDVLAPSNEVVLFRKP